jgi:glycosyltransferase involved in cell wall biosynthesis
MPSRLTVVRHGTTPPIAAPGETVITTDDLKRWLRSGRLLQKLFRWSEARLYTDRLDALGRPLPAGIALRLLSHGGCYAEDAAGHRRTLSAGLLGRWASRAAVEPFRRSALVSRTTAAVARLESAVIAGPVAARFDRTRSPLYLRADVSFGVKAGGSVGHTAGVINNLGTAGVPPIVLSTDRLPMVRSDIVVHPIAPDESFWNYRELPAMVMNDAVQETAEPVLRARPIAFVYQRYTLFGYAAIALARAHGVPLVTEYNGSEVWVARHWGRPLTYETLAARIEQLNLRAAHLVSVVSQALADEVVALGVNPKRVLVNPNGVDPARYHPGVDGSGVSARYGLTPQQTVLGFIGTFGPWHGATVLADAFVTLLAEHPEWRATVRLLLIGDGVELPQVREIVRRGGVADCCVFTGLVPQEQGAEHLAACDVLISPHVPNADGSPFFGSPTKLFEYMAMGRGIVASDLDQIGEVLEHEHTALLVPPADVTALTSAMARLIEDRSLREGLGKSARARVLERHTWEQHVKRTVDALERVLD